MNSTIRNLEINILMIFIMFSSIIGIALNSYIATCYNDAWFAPLIGMFIGIIPILINIYIINYKTNLDINEKNTLLFGNFGKIINILIALCITFNAIVDYYNLTNFVSSEYLYNTPQVFISLIFSIPILYLCIKDIRVICRVGNILFFMAIFVYLVSLFGLIFQVKLDNLMPILSKGAFPPIIGALKHISYSVLPTFVLTIIPKDYIRNNKYFNKKFIITYLFSSIMIIIVAFVVMCVFGIELSLLYQYPIFNILKRISFIEIFTRVESLLAIEWIFYIFLSIVVHYYYLRKTIENTFNIKNKLFYIILIFAILYLSPKIFYNSTIAIHFTQKIYPIINGIFLFILPLIIAIKIKFTKKKNIIK